MSKAGTRQASRSPNGFHAEGAKRPRASLPFSEAMPNEQEAEDYKSHAAGAAPDIRAMHQVNDHDHYAYRRSDATKPHISHGPSSVRRWDRMSAQFCFSHAGTVVSATALRDFQAHRRGPTHARQSLAKRKRSPNHASTCSSSEAGTELGTSETLGSRKKHEHLPSRNRALAQTTRPSHQERRRQATSQSGPRRSQAATHRSASLYPLGEADRFSLGQPLVALRSHCGTVAFPATIACSVA